MTGTTLWWIRKEFRLSDNPALMAALEGAEHVMPVFILDPQTLDALGAAPKWRLSKAIESFSLTLEALGSRLILRQGEALEQLRALAQETKASRIVWGRHYDPAAKERDTAIKAALKIDGIEATSVRAHLAFEPWELETKTGGPYRVYSPFKRAFFEKAEGLDTLPAPNDLKPPQTWPKSDALDDWALEGEMNRGGAIVAHYAVIGEQMAQTRLAEFLTRIERYDTERDLPDRIGTSRLSENLAWGEISPRRIWQAVRAVAPSDGARVFLQEIIWREFAYHLLHHYPQIGTENWKPDWDAFPWREDNDDAERWRRGQTGFPLVDAAMRELYTTGYMHNRMRMLTASILTKHLMTDWRVGEAWFRECLIDWDPASNAMGWQWVAGCGPDAAPFFRIFNPETQRKKFDPQDAYIERWLAERTDAPNPNALSFYEAIPRSWAMKPDAPYPDQIVALDVGRKAALSAYQAMRDSAV